MPPVRINSTDVTLGRGPEATARVEVPSVSRRHARLRIVDGVWTLEDLGSRHGTWVDAKRLEPAAPERVTESSTITLGPCRFRVSASLPASSTMVALSPDEQSVGEGTTIRRLRDEELSALAKTRLDGLLAVSEGLQQATNEADLARAALDALVRGTGFASATWVRLHGEVDLEVLGVMIGRGGASSELPVSRTLLRVAREGSIVRLDDQPFLREAESVVAGHITNALCLPVIVGGDVDSYLYLASGFGSEPPQEDAATYAAALARFCALALSNLRRRRLEEQNRALMRDLDMARLVQQRFMPAASGVVGPLKIAFHSRPGRYVAGDVCGVRAFDARRSMAYLGDVSGKGVGPALLMTSLQSFLDAASYETEVSKLIDHASMHFARYATDSRFATLWLCRANAEGRTLECVDAGHGLAMIMRGGVPEQLRSIGGGPPLGVGEEGTYDSSTLQLAEDERIVLVTDGVTEQTNAQGEQFGFERLIECLTGSRDPDEDVARIMTALTKFASGKDYADDVTIASIAFV